VLDAAAALTKDLLQAAAGLTVLATSREPLHIAGETTCPVPPLGLPDSLAASPEQLLQHGAVRLFVDRARSALPSFTLSNANAAAVQAICQRLDGIPLALELAAARLRVLPVQTLADRLHDSFALLATRDSTVAPRQRTLQTLIDWSHDLLAEDERRLYRRLSVFAGGWTLEAAEAVCADDDLPLDAVADLLAALADKSLVSVLAGDDGAQRWRLLDTVRQHAAALLARAGAEAPALRHRHAQAQLVLAEATQPRLSGADRAAALAQLDAERDNLLAALAWCAQDGHAAGARGAIETGLRLSFALRPYWLNRGLLSLGLDTTLVLLAQPAAQARDGLRARGLFNAGQLEAFMGRHAEALPLLLECLVIARETGDIGREAAVLQPLVMVAMGLGDTEAARRHAIDAVAAARRQGNLRQLASACIALAQLDRMAGQLDAALANYGEALQLARDLGDDEYVGAALLNLAMTHLTQGTTAPAPGLLREVIGIVDRIDSRPVAIGALDVATGLAMGIGDPVRAARWHGVAEHAYATSGIRRDAADAAFLAPFMAAAKKELQARFPGLVRDGEAAGFVDVWATLPRWLDAVEAEVAAGLSRS
jgi:non-specific serine/threonine protein kinase